MGAAVKQISSADRQRKLRSIAFSPNTVSSNPLPCDSVYKALIFRLSGAIQTTFASGTPVADAQSTFANLVPRIDIIVGGSRTVKSVYPHLMQIQQLFLSTVQAERRSSAAAAAATDNFPTADAGFTYGTTTQYTTVAETIYLPFEMIYAEPGLGRETTWLNLKSESSAEIRLTMASYSSLLGFGNTAPVTYANSTLQIDVYTKEAMDIPSNAVFADWKQTTSAIQFSSETRESAFRVRTGNLLTGILIFARDGAAGSATTASGKLASNLAVTDLKLQVNGGETVIRSTDFKALQNENRAMYGVNAPMASNVSRLDGVAHLNLLARKDLKTALDLRRAAGVDSCDLLISTNTSSNVSYTNPVEVTIMVEELALPA